MINLATLIVSSLGLVLIALDLWVSRALIPPGPGTDPLELARQAVAASRQLYKERTDDAVNQDMARAATKFITDRSPATSAEHARMLVELAVSEAKK